MILFNKITKKDCFAAQKSNGKYCDIILNSKNYWEEEPWSCEKCPFYKSVEKANADREKADLINALSNAEKERKKDIENSNYQANLLSDKLTIAKRIKNLRQEKGLSLADLAELLNVSKQNVSRFEQGNYMPKAETLKNIADALGVDVSYFTDGLKTNKKQYLNQEIYDYAMNLGVSIEEISNEMHLSDSSIRRYLNKKFTMSHYDERLMNKIYDAIDSVAKKKKEM